MPKDKRITLIGPAAEPEKWRVEFRPMAAGYHAFTNWTDRVLTVNTRRRNEHDKLLTAVHEAVHIAVGPHGHERLAENIEANVKRLLKTLELI